MNKLILVLAVLGLGVFGQADERIMSASAALKAGFKPYNSFHHFKGLRRFTENDVPTNLPWPVQFQDRAHSIAQNYVNFQDYGEGPYFHKGCDLRSPAHSWVTAPVTGVLEGGYYSYVDNPDGSEQKMWQPWNGQTHSDPYFELALITADGYRFELHHVNSMNLPKFTIDALNHGGIIVQAGTQIGKVLPWPDGDYNHIHYNIFRQDGAIENPEAHSVQVPDHLAPTIHGVYGIKTDHSVVEVHRGNVVVGPLSEFIVVTTETRDDSVYVQTPPFVGIKFVTGETMMWDFRQRLLGTDGKWPDIRNVFLPELQIPSGQTLTNFGQFGQGLFLMRLKVPASSGAFSIKVGDTAGNFSTFEGMLN